MKGNRNMSRKTKANSRAQWNALFEKAVLSLAPEFAGRINWDAAAFAFYRGDSPGLAAAKFVENETPKGLAWPHGATTK